MGQRTINASPRSEIRPALAWDLIGAPPAYDRQTYTVLFLRALESLFAPVGVDASTLALWLLGDVGYWGPPGILPPPGVDGRWPLLATKRANRRPLSTPWAALAGPGDFPSPQPELAAHA